MNENNPYTDKDQNQNKQQPFDYQAHYRQQNQQYQNPQQPYNGQYYQPPQPPVYPQYTMPVDNTKAFSILSYIGILWLVGLLTDRNNLRVRFHVNQGIILTIFEIAVNVAISIVKSIISVIFIQSFSGFMMLSQLGMVVNGILSLAGTCLCVAYIIIGVLHAAQGREEPLPIIGTLFQVLK